MCVLDAKQIYPPIYIQHNPFFSFCLDALRDPLVNKLIKPHSLSFVYQCLSIYLRNEDIPTCLMLTSPLRSSRHRGLCRPPSAEPYPRTFNTRAESRCQALRPQVSRPRYTLQTNTTTASKQGDVMWSCNATDNEQEEINIK